MRYFVTEGRWWLPGREDQGVPGCLTVDEDDVKLEVYGSPLQPTSPPTFVTHPVVHGTTRDRRDVTLFSARAISFSHSWLGGPGTGATYTVSWGALDDHLQAELLDSASFELDGLQPWAGPRPLVDWSAFDQVSIDLKAQELACFNTETNKVSIISMMTGTHGQNVDLKQVTQCQLELDPPVPIETVLNGHIRCLSDLLTLTIDRRIRLTSLYGGFPNRDRPGQLEIFFRGGEATPAVELSIGDFVRSGSSALLWSGNSPIALTELLQRWSSSYEDLKGVYVPLLGRHYSPFMYAEHELGSTTNAAEALHKSRFNSLQVPKAQHRERVARILEAAEAADVDPSTLDWAKRVLSGANSKPLFERLDEILSACGEPGRAVLDSEPDFIRNVQRMRTLSAHGDTQRRRISDVQRFWHDRALRWLLRTYLIGELLADPEQVQGRTMRNQSFRFVLTRLMDPEEE